jgi:hypothetical protein
VGDLSDFEREQIVGVCLVGASVTTTVTILGVSRTTVSKDMSAYMNHGKKMSAKRSSGQKSTLTEKDCCILRRIIMKNHRITAAQVTAELNIFCLEEPVSTEKLSDMSFINPASAVGLQLLNLYLLKVMLRCLNYGIMTIKHELQTTGNACVIWSDESSFMLFRMSGRVYIWKTPNEAYNLERLVPTVKHGGGSMMLCAAMSWYSIPLVPLLPFMAELLQGNTWRGWIIR